MSNLELIGTNIGILVVVLAIYVVVLSKIPSEYKDLLREIVRDVRGNDDGNPIKSAAIMIAILALMIILTVTITKQTVTFLRSIILPSADAGVSISGQLLLMGIFLIVFALSLGSHHIEKKNEKMGDLERELSSSE